MNRIFAHILLIVATFPFAVHAEPLVARFEHWPVDLKIGGRVIIDHGSEDFPGRASLVQQVSKDKRVIGFVCTGDTNGSLLIDAIVDSSTRADDFSLVKSSKVPAELLNAALDHADTIFLAGFGDETRALANLSQSFQRFVDRGGILISDGATGQSLGRYVLPSAEEAKPTDEISNGVDLIPDGVLRCNVAAPDGDNGVLLQFVSEHRPTVGISIDSGTLFDLQGRKITCYGAGKVNFVLPATPDEAPRYYSITSMQSRKLRPQEYMADLTQWRREAIDRSLPPFPPADPPTPLVEDGTLLIVGGGGTPPGLMERLVELAGGPDEARLVYVPCSEADQVAEDQATVRRWKQMGVKHATFIHTKDRRQANSDEEFLRPLKDATGIWFGGGRQWNFADSYYGTRAHALMHDVLRRGGVIGGSSAGASIQADFLARATPIGNERILAPGYQRGGLGFIRGVAIDQHFSQRGRQKDMEQLMARYPQLLGIGIDESTALEVRRSTAQVLGRGRVFFYDQHEEGTPGAEPVALPAGSVYDLVERVVITDTREP